MLTQPGILIALILFLSGFQFIEAAEKPFSNPLLIKQNIGCIANNLNKNRFSAGLEIKRRIAICQGVTQVLQRLNQGKWSSELNNELAEIWETYSQEDVFFAPMPPGESSGKLARTESFPAGKSRTVFSAVVYLKNEVEEKNWFYHVFLHELRHVYDFNALWDEGTDLPILELERRAFRLMSLIDEQTPEALRFSKVPQLWKDKWKELAPNLREYKRDEAISEFLKKSEFYKEPPQPQNAVRPAAAIKPTYDDEFGAPPKLRRRVPKESASTLKP